MVSAVTASARAVRSILVVTYWSYADALIQTYTLPYLRIMLSALPVGSRIHLITLEKSGAEREEIELEPGVTYHRVRYRAFGFGGMLMVAGMIYRSLRTIRRERIDTIHAWCTPAGMIGYLLSMMTGRPLVIDSFEPHAEAMVENGTWCRSGPAFKVLFLFERLQTARAKELIAAASGMKEYALHAYGIAIKRYHVKPACVDLEKFSLRNVKRKELLELLGLHGKLVAVYAGKFGGIYLDQEVFDLLRVARDFWGQRFHVLLLTGHTLNSLLPFMERSGLDTSMFTVLSVAHKDVPDYIGLADFALTPVRPVPTKRYCTPIKDGEYWALGLPVIITADISDDSEIIRTNDIGCVLERLDQPSYQRAIRKMDGILSTHTREELFVRIRAVAEKYRNFRIAEKVYKDIYGTPK